MSGPFTGPPNPITISEKIYLPDTDKIDLD